MAEKRPNQSMSERRLGEYHVRQLLGRGGMGEVWEGYDPDLDRRVAIKVILPHLASDATFGERLRREAKLVAALRQPNIVQLFDFDLIDGQAIMVMEYLAGGSLRTLLARYQAAGQRMPLAAAAALLDAVGAGLDYAHARGAVHRDLKPANILFALDEFSGQGTPVIGDFGVATIVNPTSQLITPTEATPGSILGTPAYMSPEQASGGEIDPRSDLYSLAVILYEIATGHLPFTGGSPREILEQHLHHAPPSPRAFNPELSAAVEEVLLRGLAKEAAARYGSAAAMAQALRAAAGLEGSDAKAAAVMPAPPPMQPTTAESTPAQEPPTVVSQDPPTVVV